MYFKQLDGLRAFAVIIVVIHHWISPSFMLASVAHYGAMGVDLFFVISGYLITNILIGIKENDKISLTDGLKKFYARRFLRIFPIYYLVIALLIIFVPLAVEPHLIWLLFYQYNNEIFFYSWQPPSYIHHLWSLSIEEQYYLIWPYIVLFLSTKNSLRFVIALTLMTVACKSILYLNGHQGTYALFTGSSFFGLEAGSLLAFLRFGKRNIPYKKVFFVILIALLAYFRSPYLNFHGKSLLGIAISIPVLLSLLMVDKALDNFKGIVGKVLENPMILFLGKISYGLYLYHMFLPHLTHYFFKNSNFAWYTQAIINSSMLLGFASLSWFCIEKPINNLKNRFIYQ